MNYEYDEDKFEFYQRPRKRSHLFLLVLLIVLSVLLLLYFKFTSSETPLFPEPSPYSRVTADRDDSLSAAGETVSRATLQTLKAREGEEPKLRTIVENPQRYPARLLESLSHNPELLGFTLDYPDKKGTYVNRVNFSGTQKSGGIPLFMQWDENWGYAPYGGGIVGLDGCGPTCLSMVAVGLTGNSKWNPGAVARFSEENGYLDSKSNSTLWTLMSEGAEQLGVKSRELPLSESRMANELSAGHPIICSLGPGDFTTQGHFIVLCGYENGRFTVRDPNSKIRSGERWRYKTLKSQIRNLWAFSA